MPQRRPRPRFYAPRRVPQAFPPGYLRVRVAPLLPAILANAAVAALADTPAVPAPVRDAARARSEEQGSRLLEDSQRIFFDEPGLDTLLMRSIAAGSRRLTAMVRTYLRARVLLHLDPAGRAAATLPLVPTRGYDSLMTSLLAVGTALGNFRGGPVHARAFYDDGVRAPVGPHLPLPEGHPVPQVRRFEAPSSLGDMAADIDDLYWAMAHGQAVKITCVGEGAARRWLASVPGTDHMTPDSTANPADLETNIREVLNVPSAMRVGLVEALHDAMAAAGVPRAQWSSERVLICGHSQGGMVATALASADPDQVGVRVVGVLTLGTPSRRLRLRPDATMLAVAHDQDVVPSTDGTPQRAPDQRVTVGRRLVRPRQGPLYYAHASSTYTETVHQVERKVDVAPWGRAAETVEALRAFLPGPGERTRVSIYDIWQELIEPGRESRWDIYASIDRPDWEPVEYEEDWAPNPLIELPPMPGLTELPDLSVLQERAAHRVEEWGRGLADGVTDTVGELRAVLESARRRTTAAPGDEGGGADGTTADGTDGPGGPGPTDHEESLSDPPVDGDRQEGDDDA